MSEGDDRRVSDDASQVVVPASFIALYLTPGRTRPNAPRAEIAARHEFCDDLAAMLSEPAGITQWQQGLAEIDVLERIHRGLIGGDTAVTPAEAVWVVRRLAELLGWPQPAPDWNPAGSD